MRIVKEGNAIVATTKLKREKERGGFMRLSLTGAGTKKPLGVAKQRRRSVAGALRFQKQKPDNSPLILAHLGS